MTPVRVNVHNGGFFGGGEGLLKFQVFFGCLKFLIFFGMNSSLRMKKK